MAIGKTAGGMPQRTRKKRGASRASKPSKGSWMVIRDGLSVLARQCRRIAAFVQGHRLVFVATITAMSIMAFGARGVDWLKSTMDRPVTHVEVEGSLRYLDEHTLHQLVQPVLGKGFFTLDLFELKAAIERHGWVNKVSIRRAWPSGLICHVEEQIPVARWGESALINPYGEVFVPGDMKDFRPVAGELPQLNGPKGSSREVLKQYVRMNDRLARETIRLRALGLDDRGEWILEVDPGLSFRLGKNALMERLERTIAVYRTLGTEGVALAVSMDSRYSNGVAVRWRQDEFADALASGK